MLNLSLESGVDYVSEDYYDGDDDNYISGSWALKFQEKDHGKLLLEFERSLVRWTGCDRLRNYGVPHRGTTGR